MRLLPPLLDEMTRLLLLRDELDDTRLLLLRDELDDWPRSREGPHL